MDRREFLAAGAAGLVWAQTSSRRITEARPNLVFIMADDLGYGDLSCYGAQEVRTPAIDGLARQGVLFTDAQLPPPCARQPGTAC